MNSDNDITTTNSRKRARLPKQRLLRFVLDAGWLLLLSIYIVSGAEIVPFHGDESFFIHTARDYFYLFVEGDLAIIQHEAKRSDRFGIYHAELENGSVANMIYGWRAYQSGYAIEDLNRALRWGLDFRTNLKFNRVPNRSLLGAARTASSLQLAFAAILFFVLAKVANGRPTAYIASLMFAIHPTVLLNGRRAMSEGSFLFGIVLVMLIATWLIRDRSWWKYVLIGVCSGFMIAAKYSGAFVAATVFLAIASLSICRSASPGKMRLRFDKIGISGLLAASLIMVLVFFFLSPGWWFSPLRTAKSVVLERSEVLAEQVDAFGGYETLGQRVHGFFRFVFQGETQYYEAPSWADYPEISEQIRLYESSGLAGAILGGNVVAGLGMIMLTFAGLARLMRHQATEPPIRHLLLMWGGGMTLIVFIVTPLPWARYYLLILPFVLLMVAFGLTATMKHLWRCFLSKISTSNGLD